MRAAAVAVVDEAGRGVVESSVEVVARTLSVELTRAVGNVGLSTGQTEVKSLKELEHLVRIHKLAVKDGPNLNQHKLPSPAAVGSRRPAALSRSERGASTERRGQFRMRGGMK